jgi:hypothetical protein
MRKTILKIKNIPYGSLSEISSGVHGHGGPAAEALWQKIRGLSVVVYLEPRRGDCGLMNWEVARGGPVWEAAKAVLGERVLTVCEHIAECD